MLFIMYIVASHVKACHYSVKLCLHCFLFQYVMLMSTFYIWLHIVYSVHNILWCHNMDCTKGLAIPIFFYDFIFYGVIKVLFDWEILTKSLLSFLQDLRSFHNLLPLSIKR